MPIIGGNTIFVQEEHIMQWILKTKAQGIEDSIDKHFTQTYEGGNKVANPVNQNSCRKCYEWK